MFSISGVAGSCPYTGTGVRDFQVQVGPYLQYEAIAGEPLHGIYLIPGDLPSTVASTMPNIRALNELGFVSDGEFGVSGRAEQASYAEYISAMRANASNFAQTGSNDQSMIKLRTEAVAQGLDETGVIFACSLACYTESFAKDPNVDGTYLWLPFLPFEESAENEELAAFLEAMPKDFPDSWSAGAWTAGRAFERAVNAIVEADGPNAITRTSVLEAMRAITDFDNNGWYGTFDFADGSSIGPCFVLLQLTGGEYQRVHPTEAGTLDCSPENLVPWSGDPAAEFKG